MSGDIQTFLDHWGHVRGQLTYDFIDAVPPDRWDYAPHSACAPLRKQVRHMVRVHGIYLLGLREPRVGSDEFARKTEHYDGPLDRAALVAALRALDARTEEELARLERADAPYSVEFFGNPRPLGRYLAMWVQHESIHHGQWSLCAKLAGFETPPSWKLNWGM